MLNLVTLGATNRLVRVANWRELVAYPHSIRGYIHSHSTWIECSASSPIKSDGSCPSLMVYPAYLGTYLVHERLLIPTYRNPTLFDPNFIHGSRARCSGQIISSPSAHTGNHRYRSHISIVVTYIHPDNLEVGILCNWSCCIQTMDISLKLGCSYFLRLSCRYF